MDQKLIFECDGDVLSRLGVLGLVFLVAIGVLSWDYGLFSLFERLPRRPFSIRQASPLNPSNCIAFTCFLTCKAIVGWFMHSRGF